MENKSLAAKGVCAWVINIVKYYDVIQKIDPLRIALAKQIEELSEATSQLQKVEDAVKELNSKLKNLTDDYDRAIQEKDRALEEAKRCTNRLNLATRLVTALGSENIRWAKSIELLNQQLGFIMGDVLLSSGFISYAGPFNK